MKNSIMIMVLCVMATVANGTMVVEFNEVMLDYRTMLSGTGYFEPWGLAFEDNSMWGWDGRFVGAGDDIYGIAVPSNISGKMSFVFINEAESAQFYWMSIGGADIFAEAYDNIGNLLGTQTVLVEYAETDYGIISFTGIGQISKVTFNECFGGVGIGRIEYVPEPATLALLTLGSLLLRKRRV